MVPLLHLCCQLREMVEFLIVECDKGEVCCDSVLLPHGLNEQSVSSSIICDFIFIVTLKL